MKIIMVWTFSFPPVKAMDFFMRWRFMQSEVVVLFYVKRCLKQITNIFLLPESLVDVTWKSKELTQNNRRSQLLSSSFSFRRAVLFVVFASFPRWTFRVVRLLIDNAVFAAASTISLNSFFEILTTSWPSSLVLALSSPFSKSESESSELSESIFLVVVVWWVSFVRNKRTTKQGLNLPR